MCSKYKTNFLTQVILRLDFYDAAPISKMDDYFKKIESRFPVKEEKEGSTGHLEFNFESGEVSKETHKMTSWVFRDTERTKKIELNAKYLALEYAVYRDSEDLMTDIKNVVTPFLVDNRILTVNRLGLRYVNEIPDLDKANGAQLSWDKYIDKDLVSNLQFIIKGGKRLSRVMTQMVIKEELGDVLFNYGIWNADYPNEIISKQFILDFDCVTKLGVDSVDVVKVVEGYNGYIERLFEQSITDDLRSMMNQ